MTALIDSPDLPELPEDDADRVVPSSGRTERAAAHVPDEPSPPMGRGRLGFFVAAWVVMVLVSLALVLYALEPLFVEQTQDQLLASYRTTISNASNEANGLPGVSVPTKAPELGAPVAIVEIGALHLRQVVVEGSTSSQTQKGPGHVVGTAGPGQPGNSAVMGRRSMFGGPFDGLSHLTIGDEMPSGMPRVAIAGGLGTFSALLGIGGGTIAIMVMTLHGRSIHRAIATASGIGTLIAVPSAIGFAIIGLRETALPWGSLGYVNVPAALAIASMSVLTAPLGVAAAHSLQPALLKRIFGVYLVFIAVLMFKNALKM